MPLVRLKDKGQMTLPADIRRRLGLEQGDVLEAELQDGKVVLSPKAVVDREAVFARLEAMAERVRARWEAEGKSEEEMLRLVDEAVGASRAVRASGEKRKK